MTREVLLVAHTGRDRVLMTARRVVARLLEAGITVRVLDGEAVALDLGARVDALAGIRLVGLPEDGTDGAAEGCELVLVLGGDGSLLRAAELARTHGVPILGINLGHVGFLAEAQLADLDPAVDAVINGDWTVEERMTLDIEICAGDEVVHRCWALNEASLEKANRTRMLVLVASVDGRPLSKWACDGVVVATPTGSTAYAFSAGGPVVWPEVEAMLVVPLSAHALFARPLVIGPSSRVDLDLIPTESAAVLSCDGRRTYEVPPEARVTVVRGQLPVRLARLARTPFTDRLVSRFRLPVEGFRG